MSGLENNSLEASQMDKLAISSENDNEESEISIEEEQSVDNDEEDEYEYNEEQSDDEDNQSTGSSNVAIDLSENEFYKGMCTLLEDQEGNNILEYISLLHSELIGHNKTMKAIRKDLSTIAECAKIMTEQMSKGKK